MIKKNYFAAMINAAYLHSGIFICKILLKRIIKKEVNRCAYKNTERTTGYENAGI